MLNLESFEEELYRRFESGQKNFIGIELRPVIMFNKMVLVKTVSLYSQVMNLLEPRHHSFL